MDTNKSTTTLSLSRKQLRDSFKGEFFQGGKYVGQVHLIDGTGYVLNVEDGKIETVIESHPATAFQKIGSYRVSDSRVITKWSLK